MDKEREKQTLKIRIERYRRMASRLTDEDPAGKAKYQLADDLEQKLRQLDVE
jgi:hypothetical protein